MKEHSQSLSTCANSSFSAEVNAIAIVNYGNFTERISKIKESFSLVLNLGNIELGGNEQGPVQEQFLLARAESALWFKEGIHSILGICLGT